jgi:hypothetical protein
VSEALDGPPRAWRWAAAVLGLLPHALPMSWVVSAALDGSPTQAGAPLVLLVEIPIAAVLFAVAHDFRAACAGCARCCARQRCSALSRSPRLPCWSAPSAERSIRRTSPGRAVGRT